MTDPALIDPWGQDTDGYRGFAWKKILTWSIVSGEPVSSKISRFSTDKLTERLADRKRT